MHGRPIQSLAIGAANPAATLRGDLLDRLGRRTLMLMGSVGTALTL